MKWNIKNVMKFMSNIENAWELTIKKIKHWKNVLTYLALSECRKTEKNSDGNCLLVLLNVVLFLF